MASFPGYVTTETSKAEAKTETFLTAKAPIFEPKMAKVGIKLKETVITIALIDSLIDVVFVIHVLVTAAMSASPTTETSQRILHRYTELTIPADLFCLAYLR